MTLSADDLATMVAITKKGHEKLTAEQQASNQAKFDELMADPEKMKAGVEGQKLLFEKADKNSNGVLTYEEFLQFAALGREQATQKGWAMGEQAEEDLKTSFDIHMRAQGEGDGVKFETVLAVGGQVAKGWKDSQ